MPSGEFSRQGERSKKSTELFEKGWSIAEVALELGITYSTANMWRLKYYIEPIVNSKMDVVESVTSLLRQEKESAIRHAEELQDEITKLKARLLRYEDV